MIPMKLIPTPAAFFAVIGSFTNMNAKNIVKIGPRVPIIDASMVVAIVMPFRKVYCVMKSPNMDANAICTRSLAGTLSLGVNNEISQNKADAPMALNVNNAIGETTAEFEMSFVSTMLIPKIV